MSSETDTHSHTDDIRDRIDSSIEVIAARPLLPSEEALLETGKEMLKNSISQSREFHKTMLSLTATFTTLIASVFVLLVLGKPDLTLSALQKGFLCVPILLMLASSVSFILGYDYLLLDFELEDLNDIRQTRQRILKRRGIFARFGLWFFILAIVTLIVGIVFFNLKL